MGSSWGSHEYEMLRFVISWQAVSLSLGGAGLLSVLYLYCELREVRGWRDKLVSFLFVVSVLTALGHVTLCAFINGYGAKP